LSSREELREAELELMRHRERVAEMRRSLALEPVSDYTFRDEKGDVRLSELFTAPDRSLIIYHFMFGKAQTGPCPLCTMWIDGYNGIAHHVRERADFVVLAAAPIEDIKSHGAKRGWDNLRLVSAGDSTFKRDFGSETEDGEQIEHVSVFKRDGDRVLHFYTAGAELGPGQRERGIDLLSPVWHLFDLTPEGRGDWYPSFDHERGV
jgi:predicted dithiol-disulfide oxidoreductase (DUF899 family)